MFLLIFSHTERSLPPIISIHDLEITDNTSSDRIISYNSFKDAADISLQYIDIQTELEPLRCSPVIFRKCLWQRQQQ